MDMNVNEIKEQLLQLLEINKDTFNEVEFSDYVELLNLIYLIIDNNETDEDILNKVKESIVLALSKTEFIEDQLNHNHQCKIKPDIKNQDWFDHEMYFARDNDPRLIIDDHSYSFLRFFPFVYFKPLNPKYKYKDGEYFR